MKSFYCRILLLTLTLSLPASRLCATHIQGGNITYNCVGPNQYDVTLTMFFDCGTYAITTAGFSQTLTVTNDCGLVNPALTLNYVTAMSNLDVSQLCAAQASQSECASPPGTLPGVWQATWTGTITLPAACDSWHFWYSTCCWNSNTNTPGTPGQLYHTTLDNTINTCDDSPTFPGQQIPYLCVNQTNTYSVGGSDPDGNTLVYAIVPAQEGSAGAPTNVPYNAGYTGASPIPGITINPATGVITVSPTLTGNYIMQVDVASYDAGGNLIGVVSHQFQIIVVNCTNQVPTVSTALTGISGQIVQTGPLQLETCEGSNWCFTFSISDPDAGSSVTIQSNVQTLFPGSTVTVTGTNPWSVQVCGLATASSAPQNNLVFNIEDNACPIPGIATFTVQLDVIASTYAGPDQYYCPGGATITLNATGGSVFNWSPATGLSCTNCASPVATPAATTTYTVTSNLTGGCVNTDQVTVFVVPGFTLTMNPTSATICKYGSVQLNATPGAGGAPYTYSWSPTTGLSCTTCPNPVASPLTTTTYTLTTTAASGCTRTDNITVTVSGVAPNVIASAVDTTLCAGSSTALSTVIYPDMCTTTSLACTGASTTTTVGTGTFSTTTYSPYYTFASPSQYSNRKQYMITAAELNAMGFTGGGRISSIALNYTTTGTALTGMVIKMGCTTDPMFNSNTFVSGLTTVKTAFSQVPVIGWNTYTLTNPYLWDGTSNLIVEFCVDNIQSGTTASVQYNTFGTNYYMIYYNSTLAGACSVVTGTRTTARPNFQFTWCPANPVGITYNWTPSTGLSSTTSSAPTATPGSTITYTVSATAGGCTGTDLITVYVVPNFNLTIAPASSTICLNNDVQLNATPSIPGTYTYSWSPAAGLSCTNCANPIASPSATTVYTCTVTSSGGCTKTATATVTISGSAPNVVATVLDNTVCAGATTQLGTIIYPDMCTTTTQACTGPQNTGTVGVGTFSTTTYSPYYTFASPSVYSNRKQYIFTAAELNAMGFTGGGRISSIALNFTTAGTALTGMVIKMGCTSLTEYPDGTFIAGLSTVKTAFNQVPVVGWNTFTLTNPYLWDGISNLVIEFCVDNAQSGTTASIQYNTYGSYYMVYYNSTLSGSCSVITGTRTTARPNMQFTYCAAVPSYTYSWTPTTGVTSPTSSTTTVNPPAGSTTYQVSVTNGGCAGISTVVVNEVAAFTLTMSPNSSICQNNSYQLNATPSIAGTYTYSWSPTTGLSNPTIANPVASPTSTTVYTVSATNSVGCTITGTVTVTVSGLAPIVAVSAASNPVCPNTPNTLTALVYPASCTTTTAACTGANKTGTVGAATTSTTTYSPYYTSATAYGNRKLYLYTAAELNAAGLTGGGKITSVALNFTSTLGNALTGMTIKMGCTSLAQFPDGNFIPALTTVKTAFSQAPVAGWNTFTLTNAYIWDGVSNLLVEFCVDAAQTGTATYVEYSSTSPNYYHIYYNSTSLTGNCSAALGTRTTVRPNMRFTLCPAIPAGYTYTWTPSTGLSSTTVANPTSTILANQTYTLTVSSGGCSGTGSITVNINNTNTVAATPSPNPTYCPSQLVQLNAVPSGPTAPVNLPSCGTPAPACTQPQTYYTVGSGTFSSTSYSPFYQSYNDNKNQYLIRASELQAAGIPSGTIRELAFNIITKNSTINYNGFTISIGCTNATTLNTATGWLPVTTVWTGTYASVAGWNNFVLTTPYMWDGISNIVVQTCYNNPNGNSGYSISDATQYTSGFAYNSIMYNYSSSNGDNGCNLVPLYTSTARPNIRFRVCPPPPNQFTYSWSPPLNVSNPTIANPTTFPAMTTNYVVTVSGGICTVYDTVTIFICPIVLPVELLSFTGKNLGSENILNWSTATEVNTSHFVIERSNNEHDFETLGTEVAAGNSGVVQDYDFIDKDPYPGINYYRLKLFDLDGSYRYSEIISVYRSAGQPEIYLSPNPTESDLNIDILNEVSGIVHIELRDMRGSILLEQDVNTNEGKNSFNMDLSKLSTQVYILKVSFSELGYEKIFRVVKN